MFDYTSNVTMDDIDDPLCVLLLVESPMYLTTRRPFELLVRCISFAEYELTCCSLNRYSSSSKEAWEPGLTSSLSLSCRVSTFVHFASYRLAYEESQMFTPHIQGLEFICSAKRRRIVAAYTKEKTGFLPSCSRSRGDLPHNLPSPRIPFRTWLGAIAQ